jgi:hypothetical protein
MKYKSIPLSTLLLLASLSSPAVLAENKNNGGIGVDPRIEQMNKKYEAMKAEWEKRKTMSLEERRAQDDARWAEIEKRYNAARDKQQKR